MTELGRGVDPLEVDLLQSLSGGVREQGLAEGDDALLDTGDGALNHDEIVVDLTVPDEAAKARRELVTEHNGTSQRGKSRLL